MMRESGWLPWCVLILLLGILLVVLPAIWPLWELLRTPSAWKVWAEWDRMLTLFVNTLILSAGSSVIALVLGGMTALLITRSNLAGRSIWGILLVAGLFIPLPMFMSGWYLVAQTFGATLPALWPEHSRMWSAILIHGLLGFPWATLVLSLGWMWIEPELEEEMLLASSFSRVLRRIMLPRCWPFIGMAVLLASWPAWHEITVTDFFKIRTIAEEAYLRLNDGSMDEGPRAVAAMLPWCLLVWLCSGAAMKRWRKTCPRNWPSNTQLRKLPLARCQFAGQAWMILVLSLVLVIPLTGLVMRAGMIYGTESGPYWSMMMCFQRVNSVVVNQSSIVIQSLFMALVAGVMTAGFTLLLVWLAAGSRNWEALIWWCAALLWSIPGPILGLGLLSVIQVLVLVPGGAFWSAWLYSEPSPLPNIWACWLRFLPITWLSLWPMARLLPREWDDMAKLDGASPWRRFLTLYVPTLWKPLQVIALGVSLLALSEISASKLVTTPGFLPLSHHLFQQLHAGADSEVAALSLTLLLPLALCILGTVMVLMFRWKKKLG